MPAYPGSIVADWFALWYWLEPDEDGMLWRLGSDTWQTGWTLSPYTYGGFGRKVFIKGSSAPFGCWFSTDWSAGACDAGPRP